MRMLVVDDEQLVRWFLDRALTKNGHEVIIASNVSQASEKLDTEKFDMLFVDLRMPEGNGTELIEKVGTLTAKPKVVVCSAFISSELEEECKNKGCTDQEKKVYSLFMSTISWEDNFVIVSPAVLFSIVQILVRHK